MTIDSTLALTLLVLLVVSFSWVAVVDLTPASQRPYVGNTQDDSELSLALGYNGIQRLLGLGVPIQANSTSSTGTIIIQGPNGGKGGPTQPSNGGSLASAKFGGDSGPLRLFTQQPLAGQSGWLLPLAMLGLIALAWQGRPRSRSDRKVQSLLLWGMWLLTMGIFFSVAGFIHEYYLTVMAPAIAALCGIGLVTMWQDYRRAGWRGWLLPLALIATAAEQIYILTNYPTWGRWMIPLIIVLCLLAVGVLLGARLALRFTGRAPGIRFLLPALALGVVALIISPTLWAVIPIFQHTEADLPLAGPSMQGGGPGIFTSGKPGTGFSKGSGIFISSGPSTVDPVLIRYLEDHQGNAPILVAKGKLRFFLLMNQMQIPPQLLDQISEQGQVVQVGGGGPNDQLSAITTWVKQHCKAVPPSLWQSSSTSSGTGDGSGPNSAQLYDCASPHR